MILVFDLDDTLYDEISFVESGFNVVAQHMQKSFNLNKTDVYREMIEELKINGRGKVFNKILEKHQLNTKKRTKECLSIYRYHKPKISVYEETIDCFNRFKNNTKYIVTDGNKFVQQNKIDALNIEHYFSFCFITRRYGIHNEKPSPYCFQKICKLEKTTPENIVYIGDNPAKDFVGIKPLGFKTIRIMKGHHKDIVKTPEYEAHIQINSLSELTPQLLKNLSL